MGTRLFVGNLPYKASEEDVSAEFAKFGTVKDCHIVMDREANRSKGFCFVEMSSEDEATKAIAGLNEAEFMSRKLAVSEARPRQERTGGQGGPGGQGGGFDRKNW